MKGVETDLGDKKRKEQATRLRASHNTLEQSRKETDHTHQYSRTNCQVRPFQRLLRPRRVHIAGVKTCRGTRSFTMCSDRAVPSSCMILPSSVNLLLGRRAPLTATLVCLGAPAAGPIHSQSATEPPAPEPRILTADQFALTPPCLRGQCLALRYLASSGSISGANRGILSGLMTGGNRAGTAGAGTTMGRAGSVNGTAWEAL
jgi:hypothetical protein